MPALTWPEPLPQFGAIRLRPFRRSDLQLVAELAADPYVPLIGTVPAPFTAAEGWPTSSGSSSGWLTGQGGPSRSLSWTPTGASAALGCGGTKGGPATAGYAVAPVSRGRGYAKAALEALTGFAWTQPDIDQVDLFIEPENLASLAVARSCGYQELELVRRHVEIGGRRRDMIRYAAYRP